MVQTMDSIDQDLFIRLMIKLRRRLAFSDMVLDCLTVRHLSFKTDDDCIAL